jgi:Flp pilus assembly pilin Flp
MAEYAFIRSLADDLGQDLVEYALLLTFIALVCIVGIRALGDEANTSYDDAAYTVETAGTPEDPGDPGAPSQPGKRKRPKKPKP